MNSNHLSTIGVAAVSSAATLALLSSFPSTLFVPSTITQSGVSSSMPVAQTSHLRVAGSAEQTTPAMHLTESHQSRTMQQSVNATNEETSWSVSAMAVGATIVSAAAFMWKKMGNAKRHEENWRLAALELEEGFPGPGSPDEEYEVRVVFGGQERTLKIKGNQSILMACEEAGMQVPYLCRHGVCLECTAKVDEGIDFARRDSQCHNADNVKEGYVCTCSTYVGGNGMKLQMGMVEEAYKKQFGKFEEEERQREEKKKGFGF